MITLKQLELINILVCAKVNEESQVINYNNLESALSVQYSYYDTDEQIASALLRSLIINHGFADGNKRTAVMACTIIKQPILSDKNLAKIANDIAIGTIRDVDEIANLLYHGKEKVL